MNKHQCAKVREIVTYDESVVITVLIEMGECERKGNEGTRSEKGTDGRPL